jgi:hypothetical protein
MHRDAQTPLNPDSLSLASYRFLFGHKNRIAEKH